MINKPMVWGDMKTLVDTVKDISKQCENKIPELNPNNHVRVLTDDGPVCVRLAYNYNMGAWLLIPVFEVPDENEGNKISDRMSASLN